MNVELEKSFSFNCVMVDQESPPWINTFDARLRMRVASDSNQEYNIAYERIKFWFYDVMQDSVLIQQDHDRYSQWRDVGARCLDFPTYPLDQVVGLMLMSKVTAIVEGRIDIMQVAISSPQDDFISYLCDQHDNLHWFEESGWWKDHGPVHCTLPRRPKNYGKVIAISRSNDWKDHALDWAATNSQGGNVSVLSARDHDAEK